MKNSKGGYGVVCQRVMDSDVLRRDSKVIYAYLCSYADKDGVCYPTRARIKAALQMNDKTFKRYMDPLIDLGVVEVERTTNPRGLLGRNIYHLTAGCISAGCISAGCISAGCISPSCILSRYISIKMHLKGQYKH